MRCEVDLGKCGVIWSIHKQPSWIYGADLYYETFRADGAAYAGNRELF